jgi:Bacterial PH domain/Domain of unknown function (DUF4429)/Short C-terminal domain
MAKNELGDGTLQIMPDGVLLMFAGIMAQPIKRKASPRFIPFAAISDVEVNRTKHGWGYLRLVLAGASHTDRFQPEYDLNTVRVLKDAHHDEVAHIAEQLRRLIAGPHATIHPNLLPQAAQPPVPVHPHDQMPNVRADPRTRSAYPPATSHDYGSSSAPMRPGPSYGPRSFPQHGPTPTFQPTQSVSPTQPVTPKQPVAPKQSVTPKQTRKERLVEEASAGGTRSDIANAAARMNYTFGGKREIRSLHKHVLVGETVNFMAQGTFGDNQGIVVLTNERLLFYYDGWVTQRLEDFPLGRITAVTTKNGFGSGDLIVRTGGASEIIKSIVNSDLRALADRLRAEIGTPRNISKVAPTAPGKPASNNHQEPASDALANLRQLGELRDAGVISIEEFEGKKAELLKRI